MVRSASRIARAISRHGSVARHANWICTSCQTTSELSSAGDQGTITIQNHRYKTDEWLNTPDSIISAISRKLYLQEHHPLTITRKLVESKFPGFRYYNNLFPVVTTHQNFDSLAFPNNHPGRSRTDTYYLNKKTVLRTHTSAHQVDIFRANASDGFLISADVYRRDAVDRCHYPVFHQMEGAKTWDKKNFSSLQSQIWKDVAALPKHNITVSDPHPTTHPERNPLQSVHDADDVEAVAVHLKRSLENVVVDIFSWAREAKTALGRDDHVDNADMSEEQLKVRWVEADFPFTTPSWELEVYWQGEWLEVLGCGVVKQDLLNNAQVPDRIGWAFGIGLERIAMILFNIPDIRLFWSTDSRFLAQFSESSLPLINRFVPFSKHPKCYKDISFWLNNSTASDSSSKPATAEFHENDLMEIVRNECGDLAEDVRLVDEFTHPKTGLQSKCYRINYRSPERTLTNQETNELHERVRETLAQTLGVQLR